MLMALDNGKSTLKLQRSNALDGIELEQRLNNLSPFSSVHLQNCATWSAANTDDVWASPASVTMAGAANTATESSAMHGATSMASARTALVCALPAGMESTAPSKAVRRGNNLLVFI